MAAKLERKLAAIMVADIAGFSALMERDETRTFDRIRTLRDTLINPKVAEHGGRVIKMTGDGFLAEFPSATAALQCGISIQRHNQLSEDAQSAEDRIHMRIGINVGDIIIDGSDVAGDGVVIAARLEPLAPRDGICVSATVREHIRQELGIEYEDLGDQHVKNIARPIRAYRIALAGKKSVDVKGARIIIKRAARSLPRKATIVVATAVLVAAIAIVAGYTGVLPARSPAAGAAAATDTRMTFAILPFSSPEGDKQAAAFATSLGEAFVTRQTNSPWSRVVSRESVDAALRKHLSPMDVGRALNVRYLVRGQISRSGDKFAANLSIVDAASEQVLGTRDLSWPVDRPVNVFREDIDVAIGRLAGRGYLRELEKVKLKKSEDLDARDLAYLAQNGWDNTKESYDKVMPLLQRALAQLPDFPLALMIVAKVNLCECRKTWAKNPEEQEKVGAEALDKYLSLYPNDRTMLLFKVYLHEIHGRYDDALVILDRLLERSPDDPQLLSRKAYSFMKMERNKEALALVQAVLREDSSWQNRAFASSLYFKLANYTASGEMAQRAIAEMDKLDRADAWTGGVMLVRVASAAGLGRMPQARAALDDFRAAVPEARTIAQIKKWMDPRAELAGYEPLYAALRNAGVPD